MLTVAIETSTNIGSVACVANGRPVCDRVFKEGLAHGQDLLKEIDACVREAEWTKSDIELVAVSVGPGSYTGLRVGVAAAKGLAYALDIPVISVCSLDVMAENGPRTADHVAVVVDARRSQIYGSVYANVGFSFHRERGPVLSSPEEFVSTLETPVFVLGDAIEKYPQVFAMRGLQGMPQAFWRPSAAKLGLLGEKAYIIGERTDCETLVPLYMRLPEAEEKWRERNAAEETE